MDKIVMVVFFVSWILCGCSIETIFEGSGNLAVTVITLLVAIACAVVMGSNYE